LALFTLIATSQRNETVPIGIGPTTPKILEGNELLIYDKEYRYSLFTQEISSISTKVW
jgi:hypothetical protein